MESRQHTLDLGHHRCISFFDLWISPWATISVRFGARSAAEPSG
jgi:hypothetical protein